MECWWYQSLSSFEMECWWYTERTRKHFDRAIYLFEQKKIGENVPFEEAIDFLTESETEATTQAMT